MSATNKTPNLNLSQFLDEDRPSWKTDYNSDMAKIDAQITQNAPGLFGCVGNFGSGRDGWFQAVGSLYATRLGKFWKCEFNLLIHTNAPPANATTYHYGIDMNLIQGRFDKPVRLSGYCMGKFSGKLEVQNADGITLCGHYAGLAGGFELVDNRWLVPARYFTNDPGSIATGGTYGGWSQDKPISAQGNRWTGFFIVEEV